MQGIYNKFAKDVLIVGGTNVLVAVSGIILLALLTKNLGAHDYGIWSQFIVTITLLWTFINLGLPFAMTRFLAAKTDKGQIREEFYSVLAFVFFASIVVSSLMVVFAVPFAKAFFDGATQVVIIMSGVILLSALRGVYLGFFRTFRQMKNYSVFMIADAYAQVGVVAYLISHGHGILSILLAVLVIRAVALFILFFFIKSQIGIRRPHFSRMKEYLRFSIPTIPGNISSWIISSSDRYVIIYFIGASAVGIYSAAYALGSVIVMPAAVLGFVLPPTLSKLYDEGRMAEVKTHLSYSLKYLLALAIPFVFGAGILAGPVLRMFSTAEIATQGYFIVPIIALSVLFLVAYTPIVHIIALVKKTRISGIIWAVCASANLGLNILIVPRLGILGAAVTTLIAYGLALGLTSYYSFREFKFFIDWQFIGKSVLASVIMSAAIWAMSPQGTSATIGTMVAGVAIYGAALFLLKGFGKTEISFFMDLLRRS